MSKHIVVAFTGKKQCGKDSAAKTLIEKGFTKIAFAGGLKMIVAEMLNVPVEYFEYEDFKSTVHAPSGRTYREWLQYIGTDCFRNYWPDVHANWWRDEVLLSGAKAIVVPDLRFPNEVDFIRSGEFRSLIIRIRRPGMEINDTHLSEQFYEQLLDIDCDIINDGTIQDLQYKVLVEVNKRFHLTREDIVRFQNGE